MSVVRAALASRSWRCVWPASGSGGWGGCLGGGSAPVGPAVGPESARSVVQTVANGQKWGAPRSAVRGPGRIEVR